MNVPGMHTQDDKDLRFPLMRLPHELIVKVLLNISNTSFHKVCRQFYLFSISDAHKAQWLVAQYGYTTELFNVIWKFRFMQQTRHTQQACQCRQQKDPLKSFCPVEYRQMFLIYNLMQYTFPKDQGHPILDSVCLKKAIQYGHTELIQFLLDLGCDPNAQAEKKAQNRIKGICKKFIQEISLITNIRHEDEATSNQDPTADAQPPSRGVSKEAMKELKCSLLFQAVQKNQRLIVQALLMPSATVAGVPSEQQPFIQSEVAVNLPATHDTDTRMPSMLDLLSTTLTRQPLPLIHHADSAATLSNDATHGSSSKRQPLRQEVLSVCLNRALKQNQGDLALLFAQTGVVQCEMKTLFNLLTRANLRRLISRNNRHYEKAILLAIQTLSAAHFDRCQPHLMRSAAEIGNLDVMQALVRRGGDVNAWDGAPLYTSLYSGNTAITSYLVGIPETNLDYVSHRQLLFCVVLLIMEFCAMSLFAALVILWGCGLLTTHQPTLQALSDLVYMAVPTSIALICMYRLVPFHRVIQCLQIYRAEKKRRATMLP